MLESRQEADETQVVQNVPIPATGVKKKSRKRTRKQAGTETNKRRKTSGTHLQSEPQSTGESSPYFKQPTLSPLPLLRHSNKSAVVTAAIRAQPSPSPRVVSASVPVYSHSVKPVLI